MKYVQKEKETLVWVFDRSSCHRGFATDSLKVTTMNVLAGGGQAKLRDAAWGGKLQRMALNVGREWHSMWAENGTQCGQRMALNVGREWHSMWAENGTQCGQRMAPNVGREWHSMWAENGTQCGQRMALNVGREWHSMWAENGTQCGQRMALNVGVLEGTKGVLEERGINTTTLRGDNMRKFLPIMTIKF